MAVEYAIVSKADGLTQFYGGDVVSYGMTLPTFVDSTTDMVTYADIDDAYTSLDRLMEIYPAMPLMIARYVTVDSE